PPGAGKTTLLRAFTPAALRSFRNAKKTQAETYQRLIARQVLDEEEGPQLLGVLLSCASGYADLPPGASMATEGLFRSLLDCRIVLRSLRNLVSFLGSDSTEQLHSICLDYDALASDLKAIPTVSSAVDLLRWAEQRERTVYAALDSIAGAITTGITSHVRFEGVLWLQSVKFIVGGKPVAPKRLLMIDDLHKLRRKQRELLIRELTDIRPTIPVWLAERSIALGAELLSQGAREGRDIREYQLDDIWGGSKGSYQFGNFAQNILDRRLDTQTLIPAGAFSQYLRAELSFDDVQTQVKKGRDIFKAEAQ